MYAVVETGGKQYRVAEGDIITVEKLDGEVGNSVELGKVLLVAKDGQVQVGKPLVEGAKVVAKVLRHDKAKKILVFHYKAKKNIRKRYGHRQPFTRLQVEKIEA